MTDLSPAAQAILDAAHNRWLNVDDDIPAQVAAALRAAGKQFYYDWNGMCCEEHLKAIAAELESSDD